jgi:hypothetical protein
MLVAVMLLPTMGRAVEGWTAFPRADELFQELQADPRHVQIAGQFYRQSGENLGDVALGHSWGLARWEGSGEDPWRVQYDIEGMAYSGFRLGAGNTEFQAIDFFGILPVEVRRGAASGQFMLFHESSHLGDDYIRRTGVLGSPYSIDGLRALAGYEPLTGLRLYGGGIYLLHPAPRPQRTGAQAGFDFQGRVHQGWKLPYRFYLAEDFQAHGNAAWNPDSETVVGERLGIKGFDRSMRVFVGYYVGHSPFGQFYQQREEYSFLGLAFDF